MVLCNVSLNNVCPMPMLGPQILCISFLNNTYLSSLSLIYFEPFRVHCEFEIHECICV